MIGLHRHEIRERGALADLDRLLVESDGLLVAPGAPRNGAQVIQGIGRMALVVHGARFRQRIGQAGRRVLVCVGAPIRHAELDQCIASFLALAARARGVDDATDVGDGALGLPGLRARRPRRS